MEWVQKDDFVYLLLHLMESFDFSEFEAQYQLGGVGRRAYDPKMMVTLLSYAYSQGSFSYRQIERCCHRDLAFKLICGDDPPDHTAIARFMKRCSPQFVHVFEQVLDVCVEVGMVNVGVVAIDGTKIGANASLQANRSPETLHRMAEEMMEEADRINAAEDARFGDRRGDELPLEWQNDPGRPAKLRAFLDRKRRVDEALERAKPVARKSFKKDVNAVEGAVRKLNAARAALEREMRDVQKRRLPDNGERASRRRSTRKPIKDHVSVVKATQRVTEMEQHLASVEAEVEQRQKQRKPPKQVKVNLTDPDSKPMPLRGGGYIQGYNAQVSAADDQIVIATDVTTSTNDVGSFAPMMEASVAAVDRHKPGDKIGTCVLDAGYCSEDAIRADGPDRLIAVGRDPAKSKAPRTNPYILAMGERLKPGTPGRELYKRRAVVESVFGTIKEAMGFRRFGRRGLPAVQDQWTLVTAVFNMRRLAAHLGFTLG